MSTAYLALHVPSGRMFHCQHCRRNVDSPRLCQEGIRNLSESAMEFPKASTG